MRHLEVWAWTVVAVLAFGCAGSEDDPLPDGWKDAQAMPIMQSQCADSTPLPPPESLEVTTWTPMVEATFHNAFFRCNQSACAFRRNDGDTAMVLIQACDLNPEGVAKCSCVYEIRLSVTGAPSALEVYRRGDNYGAPAGAPKHVGRVDRPTM